MTDWTRTKKLRWIKADRGKPYQGGVNVQCQQLYERPTGGCVVSVDSRTGETYDTYIPEFESQWRDVQNDI